MDIFWPTGAVEWGFNNDGFSEDKAKVLHVPRIQTYEKLTTLDKYLSVRQN